MKYTAVIYCLTTDDKSCSNQKNFDNAMNGYWQAIADLGLEDGKDIVGYNNGYDRQELNKIVRQYGSDKTGYDMYATVAYSNGKTKYFAFGNYTAAQWTQYWKIMILDTRKLSDKRTVILPNTHEEQKGDEEGTDNGSGEGEGSEGGTKDGTGKGIGLPNLCTLGILPQKLCNMSWLWALAAAYAGYRAVKSEDKKQQLAFGALGVVALNQYLLTAKK